MEDILSGIDDSQRQAVVIDRIVTNLAKSMSPPPPPPPSPAIITTPPADESTALARASAIIEAGASIHEGRAHLKESSMTAQTDEPKLSWTEHYFSTPAGLLELSLLEPALQQRSADRRAHWEEKRERNVRAYPGLFHVGDTKTRRHGEMLVKKPIEMEELLTLKEFLEEEGEWESIEAKMRDGVRKAKEMDSGWELIGKDEGDENS